MDTVKWKKRNRGFTKRIHVWVQSSTDFIDSVVVWVSTMYNSKGNENPIAKGNARTSRMTIQYQ